MTNNTNDMNRDPITGAPGAHPVGVGLGGTGGAVAGAVIGSLLGPIGTLVGGAVGTIAGAAAGKGAAERMDPTAEAAYWRNEYASRPYYDRAYQYEDYAPAYVYGDELRATSGMNAWDENLAREGWDKAKAQSKLAWNKARDAVRDAFDRSDRTYRTYDAVDREYAESYKGTDYFKPGFDYEGDYQPAYRYGAQARSNNADKAWDNAIESDLERGWDRAKGKSRMTWTEAKNAVRDAWDRVERTLPGDSDGDER